MRQDIKNLLVFVLQIFLFLSFSYMFIVFIFKSNDITNRGQILELQIKLTQKKDRGIKIVTYKKKKIDSAFYPIANINNSNHLDFFIRDTKNFTINRDTKIIIDKASNDLTEDEKSFIQRIIFK